MKKSKKEKQQTAPPPSRHISAKDVRYMVQAQKPKAAERKKEQISKKQFDKQLKTARNKLLFNLRVMAGLYAFILVFNVAAPFYVSMEMAWKNFFQIAICVIHTYNILSAWGYFKHKFATVWLLSFRFVEAIYYYFIRPGRLYWPVFGILVAMDILFLIIFTYDNAKYEEIDKPLEEGMDV